MVVVYVCLCMSVPNKTLQMRNGDFWSLILLLYSTQFFSGFTYMGFSLNWLLGQFQNWFCVLIGWFPKTTCLFWQTSLLCTVGEHPWLRLLALLWLWVLLGLILLSSHAKRCSGLRYADFFSDNCNTTLQFQLGFLEKRLYRIIFTMYNAVYRLQCIV